MATIDLASGERIERRARRADSVAGARIGTPAVASRALESLLGSGAARARILGVSDFAVWIATPSASRGQGCAVVATSDAVRLPNGLVIAATAAERPFASVSAGDNAIVGGGETVVGRLAIRPVRWWNPRPSLEPVAAAALEGRLAAIRTRLGATDRSALEAALVAGDAERAGRVAASLLGGGAGLTPYNDDVIAAALAATRLLAEALGAPASTSAASLVERTAATLLPIVDVRTTTFSAALLRHASRGEVAEPVARVLHALTGWGDIDGALAGLLRVGHSSGLGLARGIVIGADAALAAGQRA